VPAPPERPPESGLVARARERGWQLDGAEATALKGATLQGLAEAITGDAADWKLLDFSGVPWPLKVGDKVGIRRLLEKAAGWETSNDWAGDIAQMLSYIEHIMRLVPCKEGCAGNRWDEALQKAGLSDSR
jgi:hypothetical protein